ncbi:hypothetical protein ACFWOL_31620 [Streptomyces sp. NPDC058442]|uniref:Rv1733c family protein n=1 Tax=Streptomyces sp. NPDC058442 TaxID=3346503 RepID=UPI00365B2E99
MRRVLTIVLVVGLPLAGFVAGRAAYKSSMLTVLARSADRQQVGARGMSVSGKVGQTAQAQVRWTDSRDTGRTVTAPVKPDTSEGSTVRVWVDRGGSVVGPPLTRTRAVADGWFVGGTAVIGVATGAFVTRAGMRHVLDRRRCAQWDAEWDLVEPVWTGRFRR